MQELVFNVVLPMMLISVSVSYAFYSFKRERKRIQDHRRMMGFLIEAFPMIIQRLQEESCERVDWKKEGF